MMARGPPRCRHRYPTPHDTPSRHPLTTLPYYTPLLHPLTIPPYYTPHYICIHIHIHICPLLLRSLTAALQSLLGVEKGAKGMSKDELGRLLANTNSGADGYALTEQARADAREAVTSQVSRVSIRTVYAPDSTHLTHLTRPNLTTTLLTLT